MFKVHFIGHLQCKLSLFLAFCNDKTRLPHILCFVVLCDIIFLFVINFNNLYFFCISPPSVCYALLFYIC